MIPSNHFFIGGGATATTLSPVAAVLLSIATVLILIVPYRQIIIPLLLGVFLVPAGCVVVIGGFHMMPVRVLAIVGWARLLLRGRDGKGPRFAGGYTPLDKYFLWWNSLTAIAVWLQWVNVSAVTNQLGNLVGTVGMYFLLRQLIRDDEDGTRAAKTLIVIAAINVCGMVNEHLTLHNVFGSLIGGVQASPLIRNGKIRAQGAFQHAILGGVFGATTLPLALWLLVGKRSSVIALLGVASAIAATVLSASSTPVMALGGTIFALCFWPLRRNMRVIRRLLSATLIVLHLSMKAPVWFLIARVDIIGGSASFDRANLIDTAVRHFSDWWLRGTHDTANWGWSMWDLSNQFVSVAETGGLLALICFIAIISRSFALVGNARKDVDGDFRKEMSLWLLGAAVYSHILGYFGVSYFDQTQVAWFVLLAIVIGLTIPGQHHEAAEGAPRLWSDRASDQWWAVDTVPEQSALS